MAQGIATPASRLVAGQTIGYYKGGKFRHLGTINTVVTTGSQVTLYMGDRFPVLLNTTTVVRVV